MNALVTLTIGSLPLWEYTLPPMRAACYRHGWALEMIGTREVNVTRFDNNVWNVDFEKFRVADYLATYDRVLLLDADAMMSPRCPDVFARVPVDAIGAVFEDVGSRTDNRLGQVTKIKELAIDPHLEDWHDGYMNAGMMVFSKCHRDALTLDFGDVMVRDVGMRASFPAQNTMNYLCRRSGFPIIDLGYRWNHIPLFDEDWNGNPDRHDSHILHYAGLGPDARLAQARADYEDWWCGDVRN